MVFAVLAACQIDDVHFTRNASGTPDSGGAANVDSRPGADGPDAAPGTRLHLRSYVYPDGTAQPYAFYDSKLDSECTMKEWADGKTYCTPTALVVVYTDMGCTQKVARGPQVGDGCPPIAPAPYIVETKRPVCQTGGADPIAHIYRTGAPVTVTDVYISDFEGCGGPSSTQGFTIYALGDEVATSELVSVSLSAPVGTGAFATRYYEDGNGLHVPARLHDLADDFDCTPTTFSYGATSALCVPTPMYAGALGSPIPQRNYYGDQACTQPETYSRDAACPAPTYAYAPSKSGCATTPPTYYAVGSVTSVSPLHIYDVQQAVCPETSAQSAYTYYGVDHVITPQSILRAPDSTPGRRLVNVHLDPGQAALADAVLFDTQLNTECTTLPLPDGTLACVPTTKGILGPPAGSGFYSDSSCLTPIGIVRFDLGVGPTLGSCAIPAASPFLSRIPSAGSCGQPPLVNYIVSRYTAPLYWNIAGCQPAPTIYAYYGLGQSLPLTMLARATVETSP